MSLIKQAKKALKLNGLDAYKVFEDKRFDGLTDEEKKEVRRSAEQARNYLKTKADHE
jgi:hypothetical protein